MVAPAQFLSLVLDQMADTGIGRVTARSMFGGHGLYLDGVFFAIISSDRLYLKADEQTVAAFSSRGLARFAYTARGKTHELNYFEAPPEAFDAPHEMAQWMRLALDAALRAKLKPRRPSAAPRRAKRPGPAP